MKLLFDVGGTHIRVGVTENGLNLGKHLMFDTPKNFHEAIDLLIQKAFEIGENFDSAVIGIPGPLDREKTQLIKSNNLPDWIGKPLKKNSGR